MKPPSRTRHPNRREAATTTKGQFPSTQWTILGQARGGTGVDADERHKALEQLAAIYWRPIYAFFRLRWNRTPADAMDLTQDFFVKLLEGTMIRNADRNRGRFRAFLKTCLDNFARTVREKERTEKRGGKKVKLSIEHGEDPEQFLIPKGGDSPGEILDRHWRKAVLDRAVQKLEEHLQGDGKLLYFEAFRRYTQVPPGQERPTYESLAQELQVKPVDVDHYLRHARKVLRDLIRDTLASSVSGPKELQEELQEFFQAPID
jgi:RNA polymerase sigma-70 factor (ECF subfamily)